MERTLEKANIEKKMAEADAAKAVAEMYLYSTVQCTVLCDPLRLNLYVSI